MTDNMADLLRADAALSALAERRPRARDDAALDVLASWAAELDAQVPVEPVRIPKIGPADGTRPTVDSRSRAIAVRATALAVALTLSSGGVAAAVGADPLAPLSYVVTKIKTIGDDSDRGTTIFGQGSTGNAPVPGAGVPDGRVVEGNGAGAADRSDRAAGGSAVPDDPTQRQDGPGKDRQSIEADQESAGGSAGGSGSDAAGTDAPADAVQDPGQSGGSPQQHPEQAPGSSDDDEPAKPRRVRRPDVTPSPHGPDGPAPEKPGPDPSPQPTDPDPTIDPGTPIDPPTDPPPDTPS